MATTGSTKKSKNTRRRAGPARLDPGSRGVPLSWLYAAGAVGLVVVAAVVFSLVRAGGGPTGSEGLPNTPDFHSLLVSPGDPGSLVLGTHDGLFRSADGGVTWEREALAGQDAMNLARRQGGQVVWAAGHNVLTRSNDGGVTWTDVKPDGLPGLDVHGFAVDPTNPSTVYAAIAGKGLYRSADGGDSFTIASRTVGPGIVALAVLPDGSLLAGDMQTGSLVSSTDEGTTWRGIIEASILGLAVNPKDPTRVVAAGPGVLLSTDGGASWRQTLSLDAGAGPIAWAPGDPRVAYVVGLDRSLYKSTDGGNTWAPVSEGS